MCEVSSNIYRRFDSKKRIDKREILIHMFVVLTLCLYVNIEFPFRCGFYFYMI